MYGVECDLGSSDEDECWMLVMMIATMMVSCKGFDYPCQEDQALCFISERGAWLKDDVQLVKCGYVYILLVCSEYFFVLVF